jgi:hypothetical protein
MAQNDNLLVSYCFLAALTENQNDLFNHVYVPICKRTLSIYSLKGATHGTASDIKELIKEEYGIDIPHSIVRRLIAASFRSLSLKAKKKYQFEVFNNGEQFEIQKYTFSDLEIQYKKVTRNANALQKAFETFIKSEELESENIPPFIDFIDKNKKKLASFFKECEVEDNSDIQSTYIHHVQFLEHLETYNHDLFEVAKCLYLGSIVASFLESGLDLEPRFESNEEYFLDTPIILRVLDLQKEEETFPIVELLDLIKNTGGKIKILSITIEEIQIVIENAISNYNNTTPTSTINEACLRLVKNKAWLINYNANLEKKILEKVIFEKVLVATSFIEKYQKSPDVRALQEERFRKGNALHDVIAYLFIRQLRGNSITLFQKAKIWFVSTNTELLKFNKEHSLLKGITEIILPDALTSLLWLKDPQKLMNNVKKVGLNELMAITLNEEIASKELINEFESNIRNIEGISPDDYRTLLESVAHQSAKKFREFNEVATEDKEKARIEAQKIVEWERKRKAKRIQDIKNAQTAKQEEEKRNRELITKIEQIENDLRNYKTEGDSTQTIIEILKSQVEKQRKLTRRIIFWTIITVIFILIIYFGFHSIKVLNLGQKIFKWILSAGGLFGFVNMTINALKSIKGK